MHTSDEHTSDEPGRTGGLTTVSGAGMGVGVGAALTAATGDGTWIGAFAALGAFTALALPVIGRWCPGR